MNRREVRVYLAIQIVLVITSVLMSLFVLLHKGKGGGLSSLFGGGMQSNLSGSTVVEKNLDYVTIITAILDRLIYKSEIINIDGPSYRKERRQSITGWKAAKRKSLEVQPHLQKERETLTIVAKSNDIYLTAYKKARNAPLGG